MDVGDLIAETDAFEVTVQDLIEQGYNPMLLRMQVNEMMSNLQRAKRRVSRPVPPEQMSLL